MNTKQLHKRITSATLKEFAEVSDEFNEAWNYCHSVDNNDNNSLQQIP